MKVLFLHGWQSVPGGIKPTFLAIPLNLNSNLGNHVRIDLVLTMSEA